MQIAGNGYDEGIPHQTTQHDAQRSHRGHQRLVHGTMGEARHSGGRSTLTDYGAVCEKFLQLKVQFFFRRIPQDIDANTSGARWFPRSEG